MGAAHIERRSARRLLTAMLGRMRPEILFPLFAPVSSLKGVGPKIEPLAVKLAGPYVRDFAFLAPQNIVHRPLVKAADAREGEVQTLVVTIDSHMPSDKPDRPYRIRTFDGSGFLTLAWFKVSGPGLKTQHPVGAKRAVSGKIERFWGELQMAHPDYLLPEERLAEIPTDEAIYPATAGLPPRSVRRLAHDALARAPDLAEWQDHAWLMRQGFPPWRVALAELHNPKTEADLSLLTRHRRRLAYDELFAHQLAMAQRKADRRAFPAPVIPASDLTKAVESALPFSLTGAQVRSLSEIRADLASGERMTRLLQGDVGAGKTVVAMLAMADVAAAGRQSALMAPTEILARQHFKTIAPPLQAQGLQVVLLTGRDKGAGPGREAARPGQRRGRGGGRHPRPVPGRCGVSGPRPDRHRRAAPLRGWRAQTAAGQGRGRPSAGHVGDADPAHPGADAVRRPRRLAHRREAARPHAGRDARRAHVAAARGGRAATDGGLATARRPSGSARWWRSPSSPTSRPPRRGRRN